MDKYKFADSEHLGGQHNTFTKGCYECYREDNIIQAHKTVNSHDDMLEKHPALNNPYGSNYPTGYIPE